MSLVEPEKISRGIGPSKDPFFFDLGQHALGEPVTPLGEVVDFVQDRDFVSVEGKSGPRVVQPISIHVRDPFVAADMDGYSVVAEHVDGMENAIRRDGFDPLEERQKQHPYGVVGVEQDGKKNRFNPYTLRWLAQPNLEGLKAWHSNIPHARALGYLTNPFTKGIILDNRGTSHETSQETAAHLRYVDDAVGIRDRATAMRWLAGQHLAEVEHGQDVSWLSLACGTAEPSIIAARDVTAQTGANVNLHVLDYDATALALVNTVAVEQRYNGQVTTHEGNLLDPNYPEIIRAETDIEQFDVVENLGFEEYLPQAGDSIGAFKKLEGVLPEASEFTRQAWDLVKPGGILISGNMILDRPQRDFVFGIVAWPIINARREQEILRVYEQAGILDDPRAELQMFRVTNADTGATVYNIVTVAKRAA